MGDADSAVVTVRYMIDDLDGAVAFYTKQAHDAGRLDGVTC